MTTELQTEGGMHINPDPKTGAIAASQENADTVKTQEQAKNDQPEQTSAAETEQPQEPVNPRDAIMKSIYEGRAKQFKDELEYAATISHGGTMQSASDEEQQPAAEEQPKEENKTESEKPAEQPAAAAGDQQPPERKPYVINGQTVQLSVEELALLANRAIQQQQHLIYGQQQQMRQAPAQQPQQVQQPQVRPELVAPDRLREIVRKITYGSEDESVRALQDFAEHTAQSVQRSLGPTPEQIAGYAAQTALAQVQFQTNLDTIAREFPDVFEKRSATLVAADYVNSLRNRYQMLGVPKPDIELYREACQLTRGEFGKQQQEQQQTSTRATPAAVQVSSTKVERKRAAPQPPAPVSKVLPAQQERVKTGSDIVNSMRKSRGQSAMN